MVYCLSISLDTYRGGPFIKPAVGENAIDLLSHNVKDTSSFQIIEILKNDFIIRKAIIHTRAINIFKRIWRKNKARRNNFFSLRGREIGYKI